MHNLKLKALRPDVVLFLFYLKQTELQYYLHARTCLCSVDRATPASTDLILHSRHVQEWMKVSKIHLCLHDSLRFLYFIFIYFRGEAFLAKAFLVTCLWQ